MGYSETALTAWKAAASYRKGLEHIDIPQESATAHEVQAGMRISSIQTWQLWRKYGIALLSGYSLEYQSERPTLTAFCKGSRIMQPG